MLLISFEGGEGTGKSTQIERLSQRLTEAGHKVTAVREPGGTEISEQIREIVLSKKNTNIAFATEVLLFQAARAQIYEEVVRPALRAGRIVLMDRTRDSSVVYQGIVRGFGKGLVDNLNDISTQITYPNLTFLLDLPAEIGLNRRTITGETNRLDLENSTFHEHVRRAYLELAKADTTGRWVIIDASKTVDEVAAQIWEKVQTILK